MRSLISVSRATRNMRSVSREEFDSVYGFDQPVRYSGGTRLIRNVLPPGRAYCAFVTEFSVGPHESLEVFPDLAAYLGSVSGTGAELATLDFFYQSLPSPPLEGNKILCEPLKASIRNRLDVYVYVRCRPSRTEWLAWTGTFKELLDSCEGDSDMLSQL